MADDDELGALELDGLLTELMERADDFLKTQDRLRDLLAAVRGMSERRSLDELLQTMTEDARTLLGAVYAETVLTVAVQQRGAVEFSAGQRSEDGGPSVSVELASRGTVLGTLRLQGRADGNQHAFDEDETQTMRTLSAAAGIAIQNVQSFNAVSRRRAWTQASTEITTAILEGGRDRNAALELICRRAVELAGAEYGLIVLPNGAEHVRVEVVYGQGGESLRGVEMARNSSLAGLVMTSGELMVSENPSADSRANAAVRNAASSRTVLVPMVAGPGVAATGVISVIYPDGAAPLTEAEVALMKGFGAQAALAREFAMAQLDRSQLAVLEDRDRIGRELHDLVIQRIFAIGMSVQSVTRLVDNEKGQRLMRVVDELDATIRDLRETVFQLQSNKQHYDLLGHLREAVEETAGDRISMIDVEVVGDGSVVPEDFRGPLIAVARESLSNALRHAQATSITVAFVIDDHVTVIVADDGIGVPEEPSRRSGTGNLDQRARALGGDFSLRNRPSGGAVARWSVPLPG